MRSFGRIRIGAALVSAVASLLARPAAAQLHDHLRCYKVKDSASFSATVDLRPVDGTPFEVDAGCTIKVHSRQVCFPVAKDVVVAGEAHLDISGQELANAFLCYTVKCPPSAIPESLEMSDQFGTHTLTSMRSFTACAPAVYGTPPPTSTTTTTLPSGTPRQCVDATPPNCDGTCGDINFACESDGGTACICASVDIFSPCGIVAGPPTCYGSCEGQQSCVEVSGACQCGNVYE